MNKKPVYKAQKILNFIDKLQAENLNIETYTFINDKGKNTELASKKEQYFMYYIKALYTIEKYKQCIDICRRAFEQINKFHYKNEVWFKRTQALCFYKLKRYDKAINIFEKILLINNSWFIRKETAEIYFVSGNTDKAFSYALAAAQSSGNPDKKVKLYLLLADILNIKKLNNQANKHLEFVFCIKQKNNWKTDKYLLEKLNNTDINTKEIKQYQVLKKELTVIWDKLQYKDKQKLTGVIKTILPHGKAGFIEISKGKTYYFSVSDCAAEIKQGIKVSFYIQDAFDKKKNKKSEKAVKIFRIE